jgi:hypothetical protein
MVKNPERMATLDRGEALPTRERPQPETEHHAKGDDHEVAPDAQQDSERRGLVQVDDWAQRKLACHIAATCRELGPTPLSFELLSYAEALMEDLPDPGAGTPALLSAARTRRLAQRSQALATALVGRR